MSTHSRSNGSSRGGDAASSATRVDPVVRWGRSLARWMLACGVLAALLGMILHPSMWSETPPFGLSVSYATEFSSALLFFVAPLQLVTGLVLAAAGFAGVNARGDRL